MNSKKLNTLLQLQVDLGNLQKKHTILVDELTKVNKEIYLLEEEKLELLQSLEQTSLTESEVFKQKTHSDSEE
jgi:hypothetical protein